MATTPSGTWRDAVADALRRLGGSGTLAEIYREVQSHPHTQLSASWQSIVRRILQQYSSDSQEWLGREDLFTALGGIGSGRWALRNIDYFTRRPGNSEPTSLTSRRSKHVLRHLLVLGLNDRFDFDLKFHDDLNILTGRNGSGKTTVLRLLWYLVSGNIERIPVEFKFDSIDIETSTFSLVMSLRGRGTSQQLSLHWRISKETGETTLKVDAFQRSDLISELTRRLSQASGSTIYFPTFRRIEGGLSPHRYRSVGLRFGMPSSRLLARLQDTLSDISASMSLPTHHFVTSISTDDIVELLTREYADISERTNDLHRSLSTFIARSIGRYTSTQEASDIQKLKTATSLLNDIQVRVQQDSLRREELLRPFSVLSELVSKVFQYRGIQVSEAITLGDTKGAVSSDKLSAGEKQLLSFLCYNAFARRGVIFIDEPELSLHVDWQRLLFPTLLDQGSDNQFIVATHSPFIYSKYPERELVLDVDRGGH